MLKILHLYDDHQVADRSICKFERLFPQMNIFLIFCDNSELKHIKKCSNFTIVNKSNYKAVANSIDYSEVACVQVHYMSFEKIDFIRLIPTNIHVSWAIYGGDLYNQYADILGHKIYYSNPLRYARHDFLGRYFPRVYSLLLFLKTQNKHILKIHRKKDLNYIVARISSVSGAECDIDLLEQYSGNKYMILPGSAYPLKSTLGDLYGGGYAKGNVIMIGNSASYSNNHLYALKMIKPLPIPKDMCIRLTLSYGGSRKYREVVVKKYKMAYDHRLQIVSDYLPLHEYNKMFLSTSVMILPAWRQESFGTILMGLYLGIKIIMSDRNPLYYTIMKQGFIIYKLESLNEDFTVPLQVEEQIYNRNLVLKVYNSDILEAESYSFYSHLLESDY